MKISLKSTALGLAVVGALAIAAPAWAGCGDVASKTPAKYDTGKAGDAQLIRVANNNSQGGGPSIVGLWYVTFTGNVPPDWGYSEWHSDGTEIMNSGGHTAASGNFCLGVWAQTGPLTFKLNHIALAYNPAADPAHPENGGALANRISIQEVVNIDPRGNAFTGTVTEIVYDATGTTKVAGPFVGTVTGARVTAN
jgi:hypothetical protein